jgi:hypothetical protein
VDYELVEGLCCWLRWNAATERNIMLPLAEFAMHCILPLNTMNSATLYNVMPPPNATLCRHSIGCRVSVQNLIRAEDVGGRFELGQNPVSQTLR